MPERDQASLVGGRIPLRLAKPKLRASENSRVAEFFRKHPGDPAEVKKS
jgi:hypothetical protein